MKAKIVACRMRVFLKKSIYIDLLRFLIVGLWYTFCKLKELGNILAFCSVPLLNCKEKAGLRLKSRMKFFRNTKYLSCESALVVGNRRAGSKLEGTYREAGNRDFKT